MTITRTFTLSMMTIALIITALVYCNASADTCIQAIPAVLIIAAVISLVFWGSFRNMKKDDNGATAATAEHTVSDGSSTVGVFQQ